MKKLIQCYRWLCVVAVSSILVSLPMLACGAAPLVPEQQRTQAELLDLAQVEDDAGNVDRAEELRLQADVLQNDANEGQTRGILDFALGWLPIPDSAKTLIVGAATPLIAGVAFPRSREHYKKALRGVLDSALALNPIGSSMAPGEALKQLGVALKSAQRSVGWEHTTNDPEILAANAQKLQARQNAGNVA